MTRIRSLTLATRPAEDASAITAALACGRPGCRCAQAARNGWGNTHCPAHEDERPSLSIDGRRGQLLWHCKGGCSQDAVQAGLTGRGLLHSIRSRTGDPVAYHERKGRWADADGRVGLNGVSTQDLLFGLEKLADYDDARVLIAEGEKAADAAQHLLGDGWVVLGTVCGAASTPSASVLTNLSGRRVWLWPDNDDPGRQHMTNVAATLSTIAAEVRVIEWADAPAKGDAADWPGTTSQLDELLEAARPCSDEQPTLGAIPDYPLEVLPEAARRLAETAGLPAALVGGAELAALAAAIGGGAVLRVTEAWTERAILWVPLIAPRGAGKSPAQAITFKPLRDHDAEAGLSYQDALAEWYDTKPKERGSKPRDPRVLVDDVTMEKLARVLQDRGGATGLDADELSGLLSGLGQYKRGGGSDVGRMLTLWAGTPWSYQRVGGNSEGVDILNPKPTVVICGGLQTGLHAVLGGEVDGLRPRWLPHLATIPGHLHDSFPDTAEWHHLIRWLLGLRDQAREWRLTDGAKLALRAARERWKRDAQSGENASTSAALVKADVQCLRVMLALAEAEHPGQGGPVQLDVVERAVRWVDFTLDCWRALPEYGGLALSLRDERIDRGVDGYVDWLEQHGGRATVRELSRLCVGGVRTPRDQEAVLMRYEERYPGCVIEEKPPRGPTTRAVLAPKRRRRIRLQPTV